MLWNLEEELMNLTSSRNICEVLEKIGNGNYSSSAKISETKSWYRSGSETYGYVFDFCTEDKSTRYFLKACCPANISRPIESVLSDWIRRREILLSKGIKTPKLYAYGNGLLLEEYIPYALNKTKITRTNRNNIRAEIENIVRSVIELGFSPISPFEGLMTRGDDVVWVDFGSDLGEAGATCNNAHEIADLALLKLQELNI